ncbi:MAG: hypothetical protein WC022_03470 [Parcubacteria group bacterium]
MRNIILLVAFVVVWMMVTLTVVTKSFAQDEAPLENITTISGKVVPGAGVWRQEFIAYGKCYLLSANDSTKDVCPVNDELACLTIKGQFVCLGWKNYVTFTFFPINGKKFPPMEAIGFSSDEKNYPSGGTYHLAECPPED